MIERGYRVMCDWCLRTLEVIPANNLKDAKQELRRGKWISYRGKTFCKGACFEAYYWFNRKESKNGKNN